MPPPFAKKPFLPRREVSRSAELERILALPRRQWEVQAPTYVDTLTNYMRTPHGVQKLRPIQAAALVEMHDHRGLLLPGRVGVGKCVRAETEVFDTRIGKRRLLGELGDFSTVALNGSGKLVSAATSASASGWKPCRRLVLANGMSLEASDDHPILTARGWIPIAELSENDLVATARSIPDPERFLEISDDEVKLAAYLLADGCVSHDSTGFSDDNPKVLREVGELTELLGAGATVLQSTYTRPSKATYLNLRGLSKFRERWGIHGLSKHKRVPDVFYGLRPQQIALFLNRFWACDGYHIGDRLRGSVGFEVCLASEKFVDDIQFLLLRLGIKSRKKFKSARCQTGTFDSWRLSITGSDALAFYERIGPVWGSERRSDAVYEKLTSTVRNPNTDIVPIGPEHCPLIFQELGWPARPSKVDPNGGKRSEFRAWAGLTSGQYLSRDKWAAVCERYGYTGSMSWFAHSDLAWEYVSSVTSIGTHLVYDLSVPGYGNFVANGIVIHNTLVSFLGFIVLEARRPLLLLPAKLIDKAYVEMHEYRKNWFVPGYIRIESYEKLGRANHVNMLEDAQPDVIIADEAHKLKNTQAACTRRVKRYMEGHPEVIFVGMSGSFTKRSIHDYAHMAAWALKHRCPVPLTFQDRMSWSMVLDEKREDDNRLAPGALLELCSNEERREFQMAESYDDRLNIVRRAYRRRVTDTPGVVASADQSLTSSLRIENTMLEIRNPAVQQALHGLRAEWERPDGEPLLDAIELWRHLREVACGFFYRWNPPPPAYWRERRRAWAKVVREILKVNRSGLDSELQVMRAVDEGRYPGEPADTLRMWREVKDTYTPYTEAVWLDDFVIDYCIEWMKGSVEDGRGGIVWVEHVEFGNRLAAKSGIHFYRQGGKNAAGAPIEAHPPGTPLIASIASNSEGRNLQAWSTNLFVSPMQNGAAWEQAVGRTHRDGQDADEVSVQFLTVIPEQLASFERARSDARYIAATTGQEQKIVYGDVSLTPFGSAMPRAS